MMSECSTKLPRFAHLHRLRPLAVDWKQCRRVGLISTAAVGDAYLCPMTPEQTSAYIYIDNVAKYMVELVFSDSLSRDIYCSSAHPILLSGIAEKVHNILSDADITVAPNAPGFE
jgi:hypothetical protein